MGAESSTEVTLAQELQDLPVIDAARRLLGIVNLSSVLRELGSPKDEPFG